MLNEISSDIENKPIGHWAQRRRALPFWWFLFTAAGGIAGWFVAAVVALLSLGSGWVFGGALWGFGVGWAQAKLLQRYFPHSDWSRWLWFSTIGGGLGWLLILAIYVLGIALDEVLGRFIRLDPLLLLGSFLMGGAILGIAQYPVLERNWNYRISMSWIVATAVSMSIGGFASVMLVKPFMNIGGMLYGPPAALYHFVVGAVCTVVFSFFSSIVIAFIYRILSPPEV